MGTQAACHENGCQPLYVSARLRCVTTHSDVLQRTVSGGAPASGPGSALGGWAVAEEIAVPEQVQVSLLTRLAVRHVRAWTGAYLRQLVIMDVCSALAAGWLAFEGRFGSADTNDSAYIWLVLALPAIWLVALELAGAYDDRFMGAGSDEFRRVLNAGVCLTAVVAVCSYAAKVDLARGYVVIALPAMTTFDLLGRFYLRNRLYRLRAQGSCMRKVVVVGYPDVIAEVGGGLHSVADVVQRVEADTVAVLACSEMMGARLRNLAWALEKSGADLCVAPALLDVAGPRTTIRPLAGLPLLHVDHPEFTGIRRLVKSVRQTRVGKDGQPFTLFKFRTMVVNAEQRRAHLSRLNDSDGLLFKMRKDPRVTRVGNWLRRYLLRRIRTAQACGETRDHRPVASEWPFRSALGRGRATGCPLRGELVICPRSADLVEDVVSIRRPLALCVQARRPRRYETAALTARSGNRKSRREGSRDWAGRYCLPS